MFKYLAFIFSLLTHLVDASQWHSSQHALTQLYDLQLEHFDLLENYLNLEAKRLEELKSYLDVMYERHSNMNDSESHNHVDNMKAMTRVHYQLRKLEDLISSSKESTDVLKKIDKRNDLSDDQILNAHKGMRRLQKFYMIPASDMAAGRHKNRNVGDQMDACECYVMSKYCFEEQDMYCVVEWAIETHTKWKNHGQPKCVDVNKLHFYIISSSVYTGFDFTTLINTDELHTSDDTKKFERFFFMRREDTNLLNSSKMMNIFSTYESYYEFKFDSEDAKYRKLCQYNAPVRILTKYSKCRYQTTNSSYRLLMPFKEEDVSNDPYIKIYHDVLYEGEISNFKKFATANMTSAKVIRQEGISIDEENRSGQACRIYNDDASKTLDARIEAFTGYSTKTAESYHIVNYGLGGHYATHFDAIGEFKSMEHGDRLLTVLFYLSDVQDEGFTIFPHLDIISPAEKGSALVWMNLNVTDGSMLMESLHGACPILKGNKWIMTRWLSEDGQNLPYDWRRNNFYLADFKNYL